MPRISRNSFSRSKNRVKVVQQIGVPVADCDFNEAQDILQVMSAEAAHACFSSLRATTSGVVRAGYAAGSDWLPYATGTAAIFLTSGTLWVDGVPINNAADVDLTANGLTFPVVGGSDIFGLIYADIVFSFKDSTSDASIAIPFVGETSARQVASVTYGKSESTVSYAAAFSAISALPVVAGATLWNGNTARVVLARYYRLAAGTVIAASEVFDMRQMLPSSRYLNTPMVKFHKAGDAIAAEGGGHQDGYAVWVASSGILQIGNRNVTTDADELKGASTLIIPNSPPHHVTLGTNQEWVRTGAGDADGTAHTYDAAFGATIADGSALGFLSPISTVLDRSKPTKTANFADLYAVLPVPATSAKALSNVQLSVQTLATFEANAAPGSFILCYRKGNDLIWWNGRVTRGNTTQPVLDDPTLPISAEHQLVVGNFGAVHGNASWSLETGLNLLASGLGVGNLGLGRVVKAKVQKGAWEFIRAVRTYGLTAENSSMAAKYDGTGNNNILRIEGDGPGLTALQLSSPQSAGRNTSTQLGDLIIRAHTVILKDLTFLPALTDANHPHGYHVQIEAAEVIIDNVHFQGGGGLLVNAPNITVRNCLFEGRATTAWNAFKSTSTRLGAEHLYLECTTTFGSSAGSRWVVENNVFECNASTGTHASCIVDPYGSASTFDQTRVLITNNEWKYISPYSVSPAIDLRTKGIVTISDNVFRDAVGEAKAGWVGTGAIGGHPKTINSYAGSLLGWTTLGTLYRSCSYVSVLHGRDERSKLTIERNKFHMGGVGNAIPTPAKYAMWAAVVCMVTSQHAVAPTVFNVSIKDNDVQMFVDNTTASAGWGASTAGNSQPAIYGFVFAPSIAHSSSFTSYAQVNIQVSRNRFDLGGHTSAPFAWRGIVSPIGTGYPTGGNWLDVASAPVVIVGNTGPAATISNSYGSGIEISENNIFQRAVTVGTLTTAAATLSDTQDSTVGPPTATSDLWTFHGIIVKGSGAMYCDSADSNALNDVRVHGNQIHHVYFTGHADGSYIGINSGYGFRLGIRDNEILLSGGAGTQGVRNIQGKETMIQQNYIVAEIGIYSETPASPSHALISGNRLVASTRIAGSNYDDSFDTNSNW